MKVTVISRKNAAALIEYHLKDDDMLYRAAVPFNSLNGSYVPDEEIELSIPVGVAWAEVIKPVATSTDFQRELRRRGVWTAQDAIARPNEVLAAVSAAYGLDVAAIIRAANTIAREETSNG